MKLDHLTECGCAFCARHLKPRVVEEMTVAGYYGHRRLPSLRSVRARLGLSRSALADLSGVSRQRIGFIERGATTRAKTARALAYALMTTVAELEAEPGEAVQPEKPKRRQSVT